MSSKISNLSAATALAGTEVLPCVQSGNTVKATVTQIRPAPDANHSLWVGVAANSTATGVANLAAGGYDGNLAADTTGYDNIALGGKSFYLTRDCPLKANTTGWGNVAVGNSCLTSNTTGYLNIAVGPGVLPDNTTGHNNLGFGAFALFSCTTGTGNMAFGFSLGALTSGDNNMAVGDALRDVTTGSHNAAVGYNAGSGITTGDDNVAIGHDTAAPAAGVKTVAIGYHAHPGESNQCVFGHTGADAVSLGWGGTTAPADGSIPSSFGVLYWDFTNGAPLLKVKLKTADGTVVTKTLTWS